MRSAVLWIQRIVPMGQIGRSVAVLAGGNAGAQLIAVLAAPVLTRLYMPADFGTAGVFAAFLGLLLAVASGRYEFAISLPKDEESAFDLLALCLGLVVGTAALSAIAVWGVGDRLLEATATQVLRPYLWALPLAVLGAGSYQALSYLAVRRKAYKRLARTKMVQGIGNVGSSLILGVGWPGPLGLVMGTVVGQAAGISSLCGEVAASPQGQFPRTNLRRLFRVAAMYRRFPLYSATASLLNTAGFLLPTLMLAALYGPEVAGFFALAQRLVIMPLALISQAVSMVYLAESAESMKSRPEILPKLFSRVTRKLVLFGVLLLAAGMFAPLVCGVLFGSRWQMVGIYIMILSVFAAGSLVTSPISTVTTVLERQDIQLALDVARLILVVAGLYLPYRMGGSGLVAVGCFVMSMTVIYVLTILTCRRLLNRLVAAPGIVLPGLPLLGRLTQLPESVTESVSPES